MNFQTGALTKEDCLMIAEALRRCDFEGAPLNQRAEELAHTFGDPEAMMIVLDDAE